MYHISVLTGRQDEDDFGERLRDVARVEYCPPGDEDELADRLHDTDIIICHAEPITASLLEELDDLKLIVVLSTRSDNVDIKAAHEKGVMVINNTSYCVDDIADHACAMILALIRQLPEYQSDIRTNSRWEFGSIPWPLHRVKILSVSSGLATSAVPLLQDCRPLDAKSRLTILSSVKNS